MVARRKPPSASTAVPRSRATVILRRRARVLEPGDMHAIGLKMMAPAGDRKARHLARNVHSDRAVDAGRHARLDWEVDIVSRVRLRASLSCG